MEKLNYIDTHSHLNLRQFAEDKDEVAKKCLEEGVGMITVGTNRVDSQLAVDLANKYDHMWAIIGVHPITVLGRDGEAETEFDYDYYKKLAEDERTVGIGECGFDYFHNSDDTYELQRDMFVAQIALANEVGKPLMLHLRNSNEPGGRNAYDDALEVLKSEAKVPGNAHFYAGTVEQAQRFFDLGYTISFNGVITFKNAKEYEEVVRYAPLDLIHGETDSPMVAPEPYRGQRAEPWMVKEVYKKIAELKGEDEEKVREQLMKNTQKLYKF